MKCEAYTKKKGNPKCENPVSGEREGHKVCGIHLHSRTVMFERDTPVARQSKQGDVRMSPYTASKRISSRGISEENIVTGRRSQREKIEREREEQKMIKGLLEAQKREQRETARAMQQVQERMTGLSILPAMSSLNVGTNSNSNSNSNDDADLFEQTHEYDKSPSSSQDMGAYYTSNYLQRRRR